MMINGCNQCQNGMIVAVPKSKDELWGQFGFRCSCSLGRAKYCTGIPLWNSNYAKRYEISHLLTIPKDEPVKSSEPVAEPTPVIHNQKESEPEPEGLW